MSEIVLIIPGKVSPLLSDMASSALGDKPFEIISGPGDLPDLRGKKIIFAAQLNSAGTCIPMLEILSELFERGTDCLSGSSGAVLVHSPSELFTKSAAQNIIFLANSLGCYFIGHPVVEATAQLRNFATWQKRLNQPLYDICIEQSRILGERLINDNPSVISSPSILALHSSNRMTSNTLQLWHMVSDSLSGASINEIHVGNGNIHDCKGCAYTTCLHFGMQNSCFYGGVMVKEIQPAILKADAIVWICPNYNDALSANLSAVINRMTALYRTVSFHSKSLFAVIVSGNSGSDSVAKQLIGALNINKGFRLPPYFSIMAVANDTGEILNVKNIKERASEFAGHMLEEIKS